MLTSTKTNKQPNNRQNLSPQLLVFFLLLHPAMKKICYACARVSGKQTMLIIWAGIAICHAQDYTYMTASFYHNAVFVGFFILFFYFLWLFCFMAVENSRIVKNSYMQ